MHGHLCQCIPGNASMHTMRAFSSTHNTVAHTQLLQAHTAHTHTISKINISSCTPSILQLLLIMFLHPWYNCCSICAAIVTVHLYASAVPVLFHTSFFALFVYYSVLCCLSFPMLYLSFTLLFFAFTCFICHLLAVFVSHWGVTVVSVMVEGVYTYNNACVDTFIIHDETITRNS